MGSAPPPTPPLYDPAMAGMAVGQQQPPQQQVYATSQQQ